MGISGEVKKNENYTPPEWIDRVREVLGVIELDPFSSEMAQKNIQALNYYTEENSAFDKNWTVNRVFMNPPYSDNLFKPSVLKFLDEYRKERFEAITLTGVNTDTIAGNLLMDACTLSFFPKGRINFTRTDGKKGNDRPNMMHYFGNNIDLFYEIFSPHGAVHLNCKRLNYVR